MLTLLQTLVDGLMLGGVFALSAAGFSLVFGVLHVLNLSHGMLIIVGAYLALTLSEALQVDPLVVLPLVMIATGGLGYAYQRLLVQRVLDTTGPPRPRRCKFRNHWAKRPISAAFNASRFSQPSA